MMNTAIDAQQDDKSEREAAPCIAKLTNEPALPLGYDREHLGGACDVAPHSHACAERTPADSLHGRMKLTDYDYVVDSVLSLGNGRP